MRFSYTAPELCAEDLWLWLRLHTVGALHVFLWGMSPASPFAGSPEARDFHPALEVMLQAMSRLGSSLQVAACSTKVPARVPRPSIFNGKKEASHMGKLPPWTALGPE